MNLTRRNLFGLGAGALAAKALGPLLPLAEAAPVVAIAAAPVTSLATTYAHTVYGLGYIVTREEIEDDLYERLAPARLGAIRDTIAV